ncbi:bifunctional riboflavin kinase/FAD synthetase [Sunxiuqinia sp. A32]|uniref:bifunctional riboflavin kinase/FAD synthetase n=1 Tax=Sunxiuqinia sp. A32 TaxID=3461496 RepID=UPI00404637E0
MKVYRDINEFKVKRPVLTIGSFDGVHLGHFKIIDSLKKIASKNHGETVIFTFYPHPRQVLFPDEGNLRLLTTLNEKIELFEKAGLEHLIIYPFTKEFSQLSYIEFVKKILIEKLKVNSLVVGHDHKFGKNREGGFEVLNDLSSTFQFNLEQIDVLLSDDVEISSTQIRNALQDGDIEKANTYLGYPFTLHGSVVEGQQLGRKIQFPTANIETSDPNKIIPGHGVYAVYVKLNEQIFKGMLNIGTRPTVNRNADHRSIEVHIIDFDGDIYNQQLEIKFIQKTREEQKFGSVDELRTQLEKDKQIIIKTLESNKY